MVNMAIQTDSSKLRVIYASESGFHGVDLDSASVYDIFVPRKGEPITAHAIVPLPSSNGRVILLCYDGNYCIVLQLTVHKPSRRLLDTWIFLHAWLSQEVVLNKC